MFFLDYGQIYELKLCALNEIGYGDNATELFSTPDGVPDSEPLNIHYTILKNQVIIKKVIFIYYKQKFSFLFYGSHHFGCIEMEILLITVLFLNQLMDETLDKLLRKMYFF